MQWYHTNHNTVTDENRFNTINICKGIQMLYIGPRYIPGNGTSLIDSGSRDSSNPYLYLVSTYFNNNLFFVNRNLVKISVDSRVYEALILFFSFVWYKLLQLGECNNK